jgi:hypothetical protein
MNLPDKEDNCPLWNALDSGQQDIAQILVYKKTHTCTCRFVFLFDDV